MPDDDNEHSECTRARIEGVVGVEGNSGVGMGVAGTGGNKMDMTADSEKDSKLSTHQGRLLVLHAHVRGVTLRGPLEGMEAYLVTPERPLRCEAQQEWKQVRTVSLNHTVHTVLVSVYFSLGSECDVLFVCLFFIHTLSPCRPVLLSMYIPNYSLSTSHNPVPGICSHSFVHFLSEYYKTHTWLRPYSAAIYFCFCTRLNV